MPVIAHKDSGEVWHVPGGLFADLAIYDVNGKLLSKNHYDFTEEEVQTFLNVGISISPVKPTNSVVLTTDKATAVRNMEWQPSDNRT